MDDAGRALKRPALLALGAAAVAAIAAIARLAPTWANVFTARGIRFVADGDPYYHVRRAGMILDAGSIVWSDRWLNYPAGADIPWPPLFDLLLAGAAWAAGLGHPSAHTLSLVAAWLPAVLGIAAVAIGALFAMETFGPAVGAGTALLLAVSPTQVTYSLLGRPDQHVLEMLLFAAVVLAFTRGLRDERLRATPVLILGALLALSFWNWLGSALTLLVLGASCVVAGIAIDPQRPEWGRPMRLLAAGSATAAALLAISIALAAPPAALRMLALGGMSGFQVLLPALTAVLSASLLLARARSPLARAAVLVGVPAALFAAVALAVPAFREPVLHGLTAAGAANVWYGSIREFVPMLFSGLRPVGEELWSVLAVVGLTPALAALGLVEAWRRLRAEPERSPAILLAITMAVVLGFAALKMLRLNQYGSIPLATFASLGALWIARQVDAWRPRAGTVAALAAGAVALAPTVPTLAEPVDDMGAGGLETLLLRIRESPEQRDGRAVLAPWTWGHHILFLAGRPVIASPFGTEGGAMAMEDVTAFYTESDPEAAERLLRRRGVQYVLVKDPVKHVAMMLGHGVLSGAAGVKAGSNVALAHVRDLVVMRLFEAAGTASVEAERPALEAFRFVDEEGDPDTSPVRLFEVVPGATVRIRGGAAGGRVTAMLGLMTPNGAEGEWRTVRRLDERGEASARLPYATGRNGRIVAGEYRLSDGQRSARLSLTEHQVVGGAELVVDLSR